MPSLALLGLSALLGPAAAAAVAAGAPLCLSRQLSMRGDYVLGGLFPLSLSEETGLHDRTQPNSTTCNRFSLLGLLCALAGMMAVEEINRSGSALLPGVRLGYDFFDTCSNPLVAIKPSLMFMAKAGGRDIAAHCNYTQYQPRVLAVIGPHSSELALVTGKLFGFFLMPQVSYGASMDKLSDQEAFPSFFRTVPSDRGQVTAMVELLLSFRWNWVAALGSDEEYGRQGLTLFSSLASAKGICIAHEGLVPLPGDSGEHPGAVRELLRKVNQSGVEVVVLFSSSGAAHTLFSHSIQGGFPPKVWVASEAWLTSDLVMRLPGMAQVGTVLGFLQRGAPLPDFPSYVQTRLAMAADPAFCASPDAKQPGLEEHVVGPRCPQCDHISLDNVSASLLRPQVFAAYAAVYSVAQALHNTLPCSPSGCATRNPVQPWELLENMRNMSFRVRGLKLRFNASGNVDVDYDLKLWLWQNRTPQLCTVGSFDGRLQLQPSQMRWHTQRNVEPESQCSRRCEEGQVRHVKGFHSCCYDCVDCEAGTYRHSKDDLCCAKCKEDEWSPARSLHCFPRRPKFLAWGEPATLLLLVLLGLALGLVLAALGLFLQHRDSPLVQASGGPRACFGLACLGLVCLSALLFPGRPSRTHCLAQQPLLHLPLAGCLSTLVLQAAEVFVESELPPSWADRLRRHLRGPRAWLAVLLAVLAEAALCAWSLGAFPPEVVTDWKVLPTEALVQCRMSSWVGFGLLHTANAAQASLCFLGTFLVRSQPGRYNGARSLTFTMLAYFLTWTSFVPIFANVHVAHRPTVQMGTSLLCALGILATFHLPKCYLLLWQPERNTPEFFLGGAPGNARGQGDSGGGRGTEQKPVTHNPAALPHGNQT